MQIYPGIGITLPEPITVSIDKEYFRDKINNVLLKYSDGNYLWYDTKYEDLLDEIMKVFDD